MLKPLEYKDLESGAKLCASWTGLRGEVTYKIASLRREYQKPHRGIWRDNT